MRSRGLPRIVVMTVLVSLLGLTAPAQARPATRLTVEGPTRSTIDSGTAIVMRGRLARARGGESVRLQFWNGSRWHTQAVSRVTKRRAYRLSLVPPVGERRWRVRFAGDERLKPATSRTVRVRVRPALDITSVIPGERAILSGIVPGHRRRPVQLQQWSGTAWRTIDRGTSRADGLARFPVRVMATAEEGRYRLHAPRSGRLGAVSSPSRTAMRSQTAQVLAPDTAYLEERVHVTAVFTPARADRRVDVQSLVNGAWVTVASGWQDARGQARLSVEASSLGSMRLRAVALRTSGGGLSVISPARTVVVTEGPVPPPTLISRPADGTATDHESWAPSVSADGGSVAFSSFVPHLTVDDANDAADVFVRDVGSGQVVRASFASDGAELAESSAQSSISGDGSRVAFVTGASAVPEDLNGRQDVYLRDLDRGTTVLVSASEGGGAGSGPSGRPRLASDGSVVVFTSGADDLVQGDTNGVTDVFVRDLASGRTTRVSQAPDGSELASPSTAPALSSDGRHVAFTVRPEGAAPQLLLHDVRLGTTVNTGVAPCGVAAPTVSDGGRFIAYVSCDDGPGDGNGLPDVLVHDLATGFTEVISRSPQGAVGVAGAPTMSADGRFIAFASDSPELVAGDANVARDVFVRDRVTGSVTLASVGRNGREASGGSDEPAISADGRAVAFSSFARLHAEDLDRGQDVYLRHLSR